MLRGAEFSLETRRSVADIGEKIGVSDSIGELMMVLGGVVVRLQQCVIVDETNPLSHSTSSPSIELSPSIWPLRDNWCLTRTRWDAAVHPETCGERRSYWTSHSHAIPQSIDDTETETQTMIFYTFLFFYFFFFLYFLPNLFHKSISNDGKGVVHAMMDVVFKEFHWRAGSCCWSPLTNNLPVPPSFCVEALPHNVWSYLALNLNKAVVVAFDGRDKCLSVRWREFGNSPSAV